jgi:hypothetical protein
LREEGDMSIVEIQGVRWPTNAAQLAKLNRQIELQPDCEALVSDFESPGSTGTGDTLARVIRTLWAGQVSLRVIKVPKPKASGGKGRAKRGRDDDNGGADRHLRRYLGNKRDIGPQPQGE